MIIRSNDSTIYEISVRVSFRIDLIERSRVGKGKVTFGFSFVFQHAPHIVCIANGFTCVCLIHCIGLIVERRKSLHVLFSSSIVML